MKLFSTLFILIYSVTLFAQIEVNVQWDRPRGDVTPRLLGFNVWDGYDENVATNAKYQDNINYMMPGLIRFHSAESVNDAGAHKRGWVDSKNKKWDADKINEVLGAYENLKNVQMNISNWPTFIADGNLPKSKFDDYAQWCADLVKVVNSDLGYNIKYWAAFNEAENKVEGKAAGLAELHNKCAVAMKAVDPSIQVGGGEWTQPWDDTMDTFIKNAKDHLDFFTYHHYVTGDPQKSDDELYAAAKGMADRVSGIQNKLKSNGIGDIPIWITENNIYWQWDADKRGVMRGIKGAIFNALLLKYYAEGGRLDGSAIWNDSDNTYGVMGGDYAKRPNTHLIMLKNNFLLGTTVNSTSRKSTIVNAMSVIAPSGNAVLLINQANTDTTVNLIFENWAPSGDTFKVHTITSKGYAVETASIDTELSNYPVKRESITLLHFQPTTNVAQEPNQRPMKNELISAYPNPFNPKTTIRFTLRDREHVDVDVFDIAGRRIASLVSKEMPAGEHEIIWDAADQPSGIYLVQIQTGNSVQFIRATLLK